MSGAVACNSYSATLEANFRNGVGSIPVRGNKLSVVVLCDHHNAPKFKVGLR